MGVMTEEEIENVVCEIMMNNGPDGHIDGSDVITSFIMALLSGHGESWFEKYDRPRRV